MITLPVGKIYHIIFTNARKEYKREFNEFVTREDMEAGYTHPEGKGNRKDHKFAFLFEQFDEIVADTVEVILSGYAGYSKNEEFRIIHNLCPMDDVPNYLVNTVRLGAKWADAVQSPLIFCRCLNGEHNQDHLGYVERAEIMPFRQLEWHHFAHNHSPNARSHEALLKEMEAAYPGFTEDSVVTVLWYWFDRFKD